MVKIRNISFTLTCITGKHFTIVWADIGCIHLIWGHLGTLRVIWALLDWFKLIWDQLGSFGFPWLLVSLLKILFHLNLFFYLNRAWVKLTQAWWTLSLIYPYSSRGKEIGVYACFLQVRKHLQIEIQELQFRCKWNLHDICTISVAFISKKRGSEWKGRQGVHPKKYQKTPWNVINLLFNIT